MDKIEKRWTDTAAKQLIGRKIVDVRYLTKDEAEEIGWDKRPIVIIMDDGSYMFPSMDDEGNDGGAMFTSDDDEPTLPVI